MRRTGGKSRFAVAVVCLALVAAACGGGDDGGTQPGGQTGGAARQGGTFRIPIGEPAAIDPYQARESEGSLVTTQLFVGLVTYDGNPELRMRPGVAERWFPNNECTEWTFNLRRGVKFTNGEDVDANSFIRGWTRAAIGTAASQVAYHLQQIQGYGPLHATPPQTETFAGLSAPDPYTLVVR
ncbi:MAG: ABC transporter substrate-binding protein, partial [Actinomycetota bacterium]|nr:ABC transporter substrate-binding protein [Actinomycetota bacterium]